MYNFTFLDVEKIKNSDIELFELYGVIAGITDYTILLGGEVSSNYTTKDNKRSGIWWTSSVNNNNERCAIYADGTTKWEPPYPRMIGARPSISYESIKDSIRVVNEDNIFEFEMGEYPQKVASKEISVSLEEMYEQNLLNKTGKIYSADSVDPLDAYKTLEYRYFDEYEYKGNKYIRFAVNDYYQSFTLSDGRMIEKNQIYWIKVEPIQWIVDKRSDIVISKEILFAGIQIDKDINNWCDKFEDTNMKEYLDKCFSNEIIPSVIVNPKVNRNLKKEKIYNFDFSIVSEEEIIKGCVEANIAVMLHGRSGDGKSARVKELDPGCEIIYLINASPDSLGGKSVLVNGEMRDIPPSWYTKLKEKCEREPNKIHIVFFDEITNAPASIQGMAFNIILDKEVNGKWKLPDNARIVAAGNELEESMSSYGISEPLFNRFAHVYIETKVEDWLKWASTSQNAYEKLDYKEEKVSVQIHPEIYAFIAYKSFKGEDVLRSDFDGKTPNADPRKWEMASKVLYKTNKPEMIRSLVGEKITNEFISFIKKEVITIEDIINNNYTNDDLVMDIQEKFQIAVLLSKVCDEHFEIAHKFIIKLGNEICATFEALWASGNEERLKKIKELNNNNDKVLYYRKK